MQINLHKISSFIAMLITVLSVFLASTVQSAIDPSSENILQTGVDKQELELGLDRMVTFLQEVRSHLDRTAFDFEALLESLDYDPDKIIDYAKEQIAFEQYPGLLRGPILAPHRL